MEINQLSEFGNVLLFIVGGIVFALGGLATSWIVRPHRPSEQKNEVYECGEDTIGSVWANFNIRFYLVAILFLLFEVEIVFLFPWATVFGQKDLIEQTNGLWGWFSLFEVLVFIFILALGLVYAWVKGHLDWEIQTQPNKDFKGKIPMSAYDRVNNKVYTIKKETE